MFITELSIKRPAVSWVMSLILIIFGLFVFWKLPVRELPDDHKLSLKNVRGWIKTNKDERNRLRKILRRSFDNSVNKRFQIVDTYVQNMEAYIRNGIWLDLFYGENQENKIGFRCKVMAYDENGDPKRTEGVWYDDLGCVYKESEWA